MQRDSYPGKISGATADHSVWWIGVAIVLIAFSVVPELESTFDFGRFGLVLVALIALGVALWRPNLGLLRSTKPGGSHASLTIALNPYRVVATLFALCGVVYLAIAEYPVSNIAMVAIAGMGVATLLVALEPGRRYWFLPLTFGVCVLVIGFFSLITWGKADIDFFPMIGHDVGRLLAGKDPYTYALPYKFYPPNAPVYTRSYDFDYGPVVLIVSIVGYVLRDIRVTDIIALVCVSVGLMYIARHHETGLALRERRWRIMIFALCPFYLPMAQWAWTDSILMAFVVGWLVLSEVDARWARVMGSACLGLAIATKWTALLILVPFFVWRSKRRKEILWGCVIGAGFMTPFAAWDGPVNFYRSIVTNVVNYPVRTDEISLPSLWYHLTGVIPTEMPFMMLTAIGFIVVLMHHNKSYGAICLASALSMLIVFFCAKVAAPNYYFDVVTLCLLALAYGTDSDKDAVSSGSQTPEVLMPKSL